MPTYMTVSHMYSWCPQKQVSGPLQVELQTAVSHRVGAFYKSSQCSLWLGISLAPDKLSWIPGPMWEKEIKLL